MLPDVAPHTEEQPMDASLFAGMALGLVFGFLAGLITAFALTDRIDL
jgi:hypothetical protein